MAQCSASVSRARTMKGNRDLEDLERLEYLELDRLSGVLDRAESTPVRMWRVALGLWISGFASGALTATTPPGVSHVAIAGVTVCVMIIVITFRKMFP